MLFGKITKTKELTVTALCVACSVLLCRFFGFSPEFVMVRFEIGFLPIAFCAHLFGAMAGGLSYLAADLVGCLISAQTINPLIALCKFFTGLLLGLFLHRREISLRLSIFCMAFNAVVVDFFLMLLVFIFYFGNPFEAALVSRLLTAGLNLPLRVALLYAMGKLLSKMKMYKKEKDTDFLKYAHSFQAVTKPGLARIDKMLELIGHPEETLSCIHVAGTNGKGSVCAFLDAILIKEGYRVGRYTSPNLVRVNERMTLNGQPIPDAELEPLLASLAEISRQTENALGEAPTQFEIWTAATFLWFARKQCDYVILETGMGGEYDATNVIRSNVTAILTQVALDHTEYLGNTVEDIARTKCGIFKKDCRLGQVFCAEDNASVSAIINETASSKDLVCKFIPPLTDVKIDGFSEVCLYDGREIKLGLGGQHQRKNAALAVACAESLGVSREAIRHGLATVRHPARLEILREEPLLLYDGAHNPHGAEALADALDRYHGNKKLTVIFACMRDKDVTPTLALLAPHAKRWILTTVQKNPRAETPAGLLMRMEKEGYQGETASTLEEALALLAPDEEAVICGSLYLYADLPEKLRGI